MAAFPSADKAVGTLPKADEMPRLVGPTSLRHSTASGWFTLDRKTIEWPAIGRDRVRRAAEVVGIGQRAQRREVGSMSGTSRAKAHGEQPMTGGSNDGTHRHRIPLVLLAGDTLARECCVDMRHRTQLRRRKRQGSSVATPRSALHRQARFIYFSGCTILRASLLHNPPPTC